MNYQENPGQTDQGSLDRGHKDCQNRILRIEVFLRIEPGQDMKIFSVLK